MEQTSMGKAKRLSAFFGRWRTINSRKFCGKKPGIAALRIVSASNGKSRAKNQ